MIELMQFVLFGIGDNFILLLGALTGLSFDKMYETKGKATIIGALGGNMVSDALGGFIAFHIPLAIGSFIGCLLVLIGYVLYIKYKGR